MSVQHISLSPAGIINSDSKGAVIIPPIMARQSGSSPLTLHLFPHRIGSRPAMIRAGIAFGRTRGAAP
ncbi:hypothetical protein ACNKHN_02655 [Shigella flexneri]